MRDSNGMPGSGSKDFKEALQIQCANRDNADWFPKKFSAGVHFEEERVTCAGIFKRSLKKTP